MCRAARLEVEADKFPGNCVDSGQKIGWYHNILQDIYFYTISNGYHDANAEWTAALATSCNACTAFFTQLA